MESNSLSKKRIVDFDPQKCGIDNEHVVLFSPTNYIEDNTLYLPEAVRMPDGSLCVNVSFDRFAFWQSLRRWDGDALSMYVGKDYIKTIFDWVNGFITDEEKDRNLRLPKVSKILLYDDYIEGVLTNGSVVKCISKHGILYCDGEVTFVPDCNPYAETLPLEPLHGNYSEGYSGIDNICLEGYGKDLFGGIYSLDGKSFLRWDGSRNVDEYHIRPGVEEICDKAFWIVTGIGNGDHGLSISSVSLPTSLKYIGKEAFRASGIRSVILPDSVLQIDDKAYINCQNLESIVLSQSLYRIGRFAFSGSGIKTIIIPMSVNYIGESCFYNCFQLSSIEVQEGNNAYSSIDGVLFSLDKSVLLRVPPLLYPDSEDNTNPRKDFTAIHEKDLICEKDGIIEYENLFENITYIEQSDKTSGKAYKQIICKDGVFIWPSIRIKDGPGWYLNEGWRIYVEDGEFVKCGSVIGMQYDYEYQNGWEYYFGPSRKSYAIPNTVKILAEGALQRCPFKKLILPESLERIEKYQFEFSNISEIIVSSENEFYEYRENSLIDKKNKKLLHWFGKEKDIVIPQGVEIIGERAFDFFQFKSLVIPEGVKCIEEFAFYCSSQGFTIYLPSSLCYIASNAFSNLNGTRNYDFNCEYNIYVPHGLSQKYVKLLGDYYGSKRDIKEIESDSVDDFIEPDYKELAIVTEEDLAQAIIDEDGNKYSKNKKRFLKAESSFVHVKEGTEVICEDAIFADDVHIPSTIRYIGIDGIFSDRLVIEGKNTYIGGLNLCDLNTIYIPCGTWAMYYSLIESNMIHSKEVQCGIEEDGYEDFKEKFDEYKMIELSKSNMVLYLSQQKEVLTAMIEESKLISEYTIQSINGVSNQQLSLFRMNGISFLFNLESHHFISYLADVLFILGYSLQDVCESLEVTLDEIEVNEENKNCLIGKTLAKRVLKSWVEDFVDEDSGEVVSIERNAVIFDYSHTIDNDNIKVLLDCGIKKVVVYGKEASYGNNYFINVYATSKEELCIRPEVVIDLLFLGKDFNKVTADEKKEMAYNLLTAYKAANHIGYVEDILVPFKVNPEEQHSVMTVEEKRLIDLISEFYAHKINSIMDCKTDLDAMPLFTTDEETKYQLVTFLQENNVSERMINMFVNQFFDRMLID